MGQDRLSCGEGVNRRGGWFGDRRSRGPVGYAVEHGKWKPEFKSQQWKGSQQLNLGACVEPLGEPMELVFVFVFLTFYFLFYFILFVLCHYVVVAPLLFCREYYQLLKSSRPNAPHRVTQSPAYNFPVLTLNYFLYVRIKSDFGASTLPSAGCADL